MAQKKRYLPRYQSALAGVSLLVAERRLRKKTGARLASPLGYMGKRLLAKRVRARSPTGMAIRLGSHLARQRLRQRLFPKQAPKQAAKQVSNKKRAAERLPKGKKGALPEAKAQEIKVSEVPQEGGQQEGGSR